jgi:ADP-ribose pyrophosphatase
VADTTKQNPLPPLGGEEFGPKDVDVVELTTPFQGYFQIDKYRLRHRLFQGGWSGVMEREIFERGHAVAIIPYDPRTNQIVLVEQFRAAANATAMQGILPGVSPWILEFPAGIIDEGETPEQVARRELTEETGCVAEDIVPIARFFVSPGGTTESVAMYCAKVVAPEDGIIHGLPHENEDIRVRVVDLDAALQLIDSDVITSSETLFGLAWLALKRERLLARWR